MMLETKILISYIAICLTYSLCRLHYLLTQKEDEEFNDLLNQLTDLAGDKDVIKTLVVSPIIAPLSIMKQIFKLVTK